MFLGASKSSAGKAAEERKIINNIFSKDANGHWVLDLNKPMFEDARAKFHKDWAMTKQVGEARMMLAARLPGGEGCTQSVLDNVLNNSMP